MYHLWKYVYGARKSKSWFRPCVSVLNLRMRVCSTYVLPQVIHLSLHPHSLDLVPLMKTAGVVENSGHCIYSIGLKCF